MKYTVLSRPEITKTGIRTRNARVILNSKYKLNQTQNYQSNAKKTKPLAASNHSSFSTDNKLVEKVAITPPPPTTTVDDDFSLIDEKIDLID